ncbi:MAG: hypothetical protein FWE82_07870 [Defluviitaleaceae bacterium]|nr:hypothetical protein [Defluviitaleaceae bacterium]
MGGLTRREAVKNAIARNGGGHTPWQVDFTSVYDEIYAKKYGGCLDTAFENHILLAKYKKKTPIAPGSKIETDLFNIKWDMSAEDGGDIGLPFDPPLADYETDAYRFPEIDKDFALGQLKKFDEDKNARYRLYGVTFTLYERAWSLCGMENLLAGMVAEPDFVHELMRRIVEHHIKLMDTVLNGEFDGVLFGDDWGSQNGLIMGAAHWRTFIKPYMKTLCRKAKDSGKQTILHCCGDISEILKEIIEIGVDCYNTVQPELYDLQKLKREYGRDLCFFGGISNQGFLPYATPDEVETKCLKTLSVLAKGGGYILSPTHSLTPDIPIENAFAIVKAAKKFNSD